MKSINVFLRSRERVTSADAAIREDIFSGGSFSSSSDPRPHFGLGQATTIDKVEIRWPDGTRESITPQAIDCILTVVQGKGIQPK